jgi:hypothetical protein
MGQSKPVKPVTGKPTTLPPTAKVPAAVRAKLAARGVPAAVVQLVANAADAKEAAGKVKEWCKGLPKRS